MKVKIFIGKKLAFSVDEDYYEVHQYIRDRKLMKNGAYMYGDYVFIYRGKKSKFTKPYKPGLYLIKDKKYEFVYPETEKDKEKYSIDRIIEIDPESIFHNIAEDEENFISPEDIEIINNNSEIWIPSFKENDDFLKVAVKKAIADKKINLKNYKDKFSNQYALNNMKAGLNKDTKMTVTNLKLWAEVLGLRWEFTVEDNGTDKLNPLPEPFVLRSEDF